MPARIEALNMLRQKAATPEGIIISAAEAQKHRDRLAAAENELIEANRDVIYDELATSYKLGIFGGTRIVEGSEEFDFVKNLSRSAVLALDIDIITGGGPGVMEAGNLGTVLARVEAAKQGRKLRARNHGFNIRLPREQIPNPHLDIVRTHDGFGPRLGDFLNRANAAYAAEGGIGTLLEGVMYVQALQVGHMESEFLLMAHPYWFPVVDKWNDVMYHERDREGKTPQIDPSHLNLIKFSDNMDEILELISRSHQRWQTTIRDFVTEVP